MNALMLMDNLHQLQRLNLTGPNNAPSVGGPPSQTTPASIPPLFLPLSSTPASVPPLLSDPDVRPQGGTLDPLTSAAPSSMGALTPDVVSQLYDPQLLQSLGVSVGPGGGLDGIRTTPDGLGLLSSVQHMLGMFGMGSGGGELLGSGLLGGRAVGPSATQWAPGDVSWMAPEWQREGRSGSFGPTALPRRMSDGRVLHRGDSSGIPQPHDGESPGEAS